MPFSEEDMIAASELREYVYCEKAWSLARQGFAVSCDLKHKVALAADLCFLTIVVLTIPIPLLYGSLLGPTGRKDAIFLSPITPLQELRPIFSRRNPMKEFLSSMRDPNGRAFASDTF
jgi:hypothetical protein